MLPSKEYENPTKNCELITVRWENKNKNRLTDLQDFFAVLAFRRRNDIALNVDVSSNVVDVNQLESLRNEHFIKIDKSGRNKHFIKIAKSVFAGLKLNKAGDSRT